MDALAATATLEVNSDETVKTALASGNGTNTPQYDYDADHQVTTLTPVTGSSLGGPDEENNARHLSLPESVSRCLHADSGYYAKLLRIEANCPSPI